MCSGVVVNSKDKYKKSEDFIGWKSADGKLEVIGIAGKDNGGRGLFKVTCTVCSKDKELFPDGYFISQKSHLVNGTKPCGCSKKPKWFDWQFLILARRAGEKKGFIVHGFAEEFKNVHTKLNLECLKDGNKWTASISSVINNGYGCPKCSGVYRPTEQEALQKCIDICKEMDYDAIGFVSGYKGALKTRFEYLCPEHGKQNVSYDRFVNGGTKCPSCAKSGYDPNKQGTFYIVKWTRNDHSFIKFGITNRDLVVRIKEQSDVTLYSQ